MGSNPSRPIIICEYSPTDRIIGYEPIDESSILSTRNLCLLTLLVVVTGLQNLEEWSDSTRGLIICSIDAIGRRDCFRDRIL